MKARTKSRLSFLAAVGVAACSGAGAEDADSASTTRDLLTLPAGNGLSTPLTVDESLVDEGPPAPVSMLGINRGLMEAPVKVVEMSDYGCGFCRKFHQESFPTLLDEFIESGKVEWKFVPYITGMFENSLAVTEAAECTYAQSESAFEELNRRLWDDQQEWKSGSAPEALVRGWVAELEGVDLEAFDGCLSSDERIPRIAGATSLARQLGVRGTPTFVVIGWPPVQGALPLELFQELLTAAHQQATQARGDTGS